MRDGDLCETATKFALLGTIIFVVLFVLFQVDDVKATQQKESNLWQIIEVDNSHILDLEKYNFQRVKQNRENNGYFVYNQLTGIIYIASFSYSSTIQNTNYTPYIDENGYYLKYDSETKTCSRVIPPEKVENY